MVRMQRMGEGDRMTSYGAGSWGKGHDTDSEGKGQGNQLWGQILGTGVIVMGQPRA